MHGGRRRSRTKPSDRPHHARSIRRERARATAALRLHTAPEGVTGRSPRPVAPRAGTMSFGSLAGFCSGYALKGIGRAGAFTVGCLFMGLTGLQVPYTPCTPLHRFSPPPHCLSTHSPRTPCTPCSACPACTPCTIAAALGLHRRQLEQGGGGRDGAARLRWGVGVDRHTREWLLVSEQEGGGTAHCMHAATPPRPLAPPPRQDGKVDRKDAQVGATFTLRLVSAPVQALRVREGDR